MLMYANNPNGSRTAAVVHIGTAHIPNQLSEVNGNASV